MEEPSLISRQEPGVAIIDNLEKLKEALRHQLEVYKDQIYAQNGKHSI